MYTQRSITTIRSRHSSEVGPPGRLVGAQAVAARAEVRWEAFVAAASPGLPLQRPRLQTSLDWKQPLCQAAQSKKAPQMKINK